MSTMHIGCAADEKYLPHSCAMLHSVFSLHRGEDIVVHFTHVPEFSRDMLDSMAAFVRANGAVLNAICVDRAALNGLPCTDKLPSVVWQRVLLPELLPDLQKILYLDSDLIVLGSLKPLWDLDISDYYVAAVTNPMHDLMAGWPKKIGLPDKGAYFNSGVLLMNLELMRAHGSTRKILQFAQERPDLIHWGDQCAMNVVFHERRYPLHPKWNMMNNFMTHGLGHQMFPGGLMQEALDAPQIMHFEGPAEGKPWHYLSEHPFRAKYLEHRRATPWPLKVLEGRSAVNFVKKHILPRSVLAWLRNLKHGARLKKTAVPQ